MDVFIDIKLPKFTHFFIIMDFIHYLYKNGFGVYFYYLRKENRKNRTTNLAKSHDYALPGKM